MCRLEKYKTKVHMSAIYEKKPLVLIVNAGPVGLSMTLDEKKDSD